MKWYKHDTNAHADAKLKKVRMKYGLEGYGMYWYCLELIAASVDVDNLTFELEHDAEIISHDTGIHYERVNEMMTYMVDLGLFENDNGAVTCLKLAKRLDKSMTSNPRMRELIEKVKKNHDPVMTKPDGIMQDKIRLDKNKESNVDSDESTTRELVEKSFQYFWEKWKEIKKSIGKTDTSPKAKNFDKHWKVLFNKAYFKKHSVEDFRAEVNLMVEFCRCAHNQEGFNRFENMQLGKFLSEKQWRDK